MKSPKAAGGYARAAALTPERRSEIATIAVRAREKKREEKRKASCNEQDSVE